MLQLCGIQKKAIDGRQRWQAKKLKRPDDAKKAIDAFLQQDLDEGLAVSAEANAYEFQSSRCLRRTALEKEEMNSKQACDN